MKNLFAGLILINFPILGSTQMD